MREKLNSRWLALGTVTGVALSAALVGGGSATAAVVGPECGQMDQAAAIAAGFTTYDFSQSNMGEVEFTPAGQKDWIIGSPFGDLFDTGDRVDVVCSGNGADTVFTGTSADEIYLGEGNDEAEAGTASDFVSGGPGDDVIYGDTQPQVLPTDGQDVLQGGDDSDELYGGGKADTLRGGVGGTNLDFTDGGNGPDTCTEYELVAVSC